VYTMAPGRAIERTERRGSFERRSPVFESNRPARDLRHPMEARRLFQQHFPFSDRHMILGPRIWNSLSNPVSLSDFITNPNTTLTFRFHDQGSCSLNQTHLLSYVTRATHSNYVSNLAQTPAMMRTTGLISLVTSILKAINLPMSYQSFLAKATKKISLGTSASEILIAHFNRRLKQAGQLQRMFVQMLRAMTAAEKMAEIRLEKKKEIIRHEIRKAQAKLSQLRKLEGRIAALLRSLTGLALKLLSRNELAALFCLLISIKKTIKKIELFLSSPEGSFASQVPEAI